MTVPVLRSLVIALTALNVLGSGGCAQTPYRLPDGAMRLMLVHKGRFLLDTPGVAREDVREPAPCEPAVLDGLTYDDWLAASRPVADLRTEVAKLQRHGQVWFIVLPIGDPDATTMRDIESVTQDAGHVILKAEGSLAPPWKNAE